MHGDDDDNQVRTQGGSTPPPPPPPLWILKKPMFCWVFFLACSSQRGWSCTRIPLPRVWETDQTFCEEEKIAPPPPPHPTVKHLPWENPAYATDDNNYDNFSCLVWSDCHAPPVAWRKPSCECQVCRLWQDMWQRATPTRLALPMVSRSGKQWNILKHTIIIISDLVISWFARVVKS